MGTGGSNPPFSAKKEDDAESSFFSGYGAVRLAHLLWEQGVEGSNPFAPTVKIKRLRAIATSYFLPSFIRSKPASAINKDKMAISTKKRFGLQIIPIFAGLIVQT